MRITLPIVFIEQGHFIAIILFIDQFTAKVRPGG